jgi:hypothetical protein
VLDHGIEQRLIVVLKIAHVAVLAKSTGAAVENSLAASPLIFECPNVGRKEPMKTEGVALFFAKGCALIQARIGEQLDAVETGLDCGLF